MKYSHFKDEIYHEEKTSLLEEVGIAVLMLGGMWIISVAILSI